MWRHASLLRSLGGRCGLRGEPRVRGRALLLDDRGGRRRWRPGTLARPSWAGAPGLRNTHRHRCLCACRAHDERGLDRPRRDPARRPLARDGYRDARTSCPRSKRCSSCLDLRHRNRAWWRLGSIHPGVGAYAGGPGHQSRWSRSRSGPATRRNGGRTGVVSADRLRSSCRSLTEARIGDGQTSVGLGALSLVDVGGWLVGFEGRADRDERIGPGYRAGTALELAAVGGRRFRFGEPCA